MNIPSDKDIKNKVDAEGDKDGVWITIYNPELHLTCITAYECYRFIRFLQKALLDHCDIVNKNIDEGFAK